MVLGPHPGHRADPLLVTGGRGPDTRGPFLRSQGAISRFWCPRAQKGWRIGPTCLADTDEFILVDRWLLFWPTKIN
jgi:hypothetical protein